MIGNSHLHWAEFQGEDLHKAWDRGHLLLPGTSPQPESPLYVASVVPSQMALWQNQPNVYPLTLEQIPLKGLYSTMGIDRALALLGAGKTLGFPVLVIDGGTALTLTGADDQQSLVGGAILPGLGLQLQTLSQRTAALPAIPLSTDLPPRWAKNTAAAMQSGVTYTIVAGIENFIQDWLQQFPNSQIAITGGDRLFLHHYLQTLNPQLGRGIRVDPHLIFWGMRSLVLPRLESAG